MQTRVGSQSPSKGGCFFVITTWLLSLGTWHRSWNFALKYSLLSEEQGQAARVSLKFKFRYCPACYFHKFRWEWSPFCCHSFLPWLSFLSVRERLVIPLASCQWMPVTECGADVPDGAQRELWHIFFLWLEKMSATSEKEEFCSLSFSLSHNLLLSKNDRFTWWGDLPFNTGGWFGSISCELVSQVFIQRRPLRKIQRGNLRRWASL